MADLFVFRSTHPEVLAAWDAAQQRANETADRRRAFLAEHGFTGRSIATNGRHMTGVEHRPDVHGIIPDGWRADSRLDGAIVPDRRKAAGKKVAAQLDGLAMPNARSVLMGGMPRLVWNLGDGRMHEPGVNMIHRAVYVKWGAHPEKSERGVHLDLEVWEQVKLSEYYAVLEAEEAAKTDDAERGAP